MTIKPKLLRFNEVTSTNDVAKKLAREDAAEGTVVVAKTQSRGKGRVNRIWASPEGGLWVSIVLKPKIEPRDVFRLNFVASVAVAHAIHSQTGLRTEVKWPNDVLIKSRKVCGVLTETCIEKDLLCYVVVGVGINTNVGLVDFPEELKESVTSLENELGEKVDNGSLLRTVLEEFFRCYEKMLSEEFDDLLEEWKRLAAFLGSKVEVADGKNVFVADALDVDSEGRLVVRRENGGIEKISVGDVSIRL